MNIGKAIAVCENLDSEKYSLEEKALAIHEVMNMPTHMSVKKDTLVGMIKWLWNFNLEVSESHNRKRIAAIPTPHGDLIDVDVLMDLLEKSVPEKNRGHQFYVFRHMLRNAPTIIEAEE